MMIAGQVHVLLSSADSSDGVTLQADGGTAFRLHARPGTLGASLLAGLQSGARIQVAGTLRPGTGSDLPAILVRSLKLLRPAPDPVAGGAVSPPRIFGSPNPRTTTQLTVLVMLLDFACDDAGPAATPEVRERPARTLGRGRG